MITFLMGVLLSVAHADVCTVGSDNVHEFLRENYVGFVDMRSHLIIDPDGLSGLNLAAYIENSMGREMIIRLDEDMEFHPIHYAVYHWPEIKPIFYRIARAGLTPCNFQQLKKFQHE